MASNKRRSVSKRIGYFFVNGLLHKTLNVNRGQDLITAWCYSEKRRVSYVWSDTQKNLEKAYTITQVADMLGRHRMTIDKYIRNGYIRTPQRTYIIDGKFDKLGKYMFSERDILDLHEYFCSVSVGRPRKDGVINSLNLPTRSELKAALKTASVLYIKNDEGDFVPVWKENTW
jgi:hypothetical protein